MSSQAVDNRAVLAMAARLGFSHGTNSKGQTVFTYSSPSGFAMEFPVPWLKPDGTYISEQVSMQLGAMMHSAKMDEQVFEFLRVKDNVERINRACLDFGMVYDEKDGRFYYVKNRKALFGVDHDYIASLICTGKASIDHLDDMLDTFRETAEYEHGQSVKASGADIVGKRIRGNGGGKPDKKKKS